MVLPGSSTRETDVMTSALEDVNDQPPRDASIDHLDDQIVRILQAPSSLGAVEMVVRRPSVGEREVLESAELRPLIGVVGDSYVERGDRKTPDGRADPLGELNIMSSRALAAVAGDDRDRWQLAGDQLIVDFDLSAENAPAGTRLEVGTAIVEVTSKPHNGCAKFTARFGVEATRWINSRKDLRLRGICAVVVQAGTVRPGDPIRKLPT
jgi:hypothetical protein